jgi:hypothetical protein
VSRLGALAVVVAALAAAAPASADRYVAILRTWYREHRGGNATTADFIALAQRKTGRNLHAFFRDWLYDAGRPAGCDA